MGCACGKESVQETAKKTAVTTAGAGVVAGGAVGGLVVGTAIGGPFGAPIGAIVGGIIAAATAGTVAKVVKAPPGLLTDLWRGLIITDEIREKLPIIGLLRIDREGKPAPPALDDILLGKDVNSKLYRIMPVTVKGLDYGTVNAGASLTAAQLSALDEAIKTLDGAGAIAITADSGKLVRYQAAAVDKTKTPVMLSPLLQAPLLATVISPEQKVLVITADGSALTQATLEAMLLETRLVQTALDATRFVIAGCEALPGFADSSTAIDVVAAQTGLVDLVKAAQARGAAAGAPIGAILLESAMLPAFSDVLRNACRLPVVDNLTLADFAHKACTDNPRFGVDFGTPSAPNKNVDAASMPAIGILRIDYTYPPALGDAAHPNSYYYRTPHATISGLTFEAAQAGNKLSAPQEAALAKAISALEAQPAVLGLAGDCGFLMRYQDDVRRLAQRPAFVSSLLQCSLLASLFAADEAILVLTANGPALQPQIGSLLTACGVPSASHGRFVVAGCESLPGFDAVAKGEKVDVERVQPHVVALVQKHKAETPKLRAVLLECTELPPYADAIRKTSGLPVLDSITLVDYFHGAVSEDPYFGIDWKKLADTPAFSASV